VSKHDPAVLSARGKIGGLKATRAEPERIAQAQEELAEAKDSAFIQDLLDGKVLTEKGLARLAVLLAPDPGEQQAAS